uniref:Reverse transcriptase domain-containing protein n=1 Tax=Tanacetum cinerariifolium TaxID=118510 RepID=A0A6L2J1D9_TANCI|nr:hypothetical protein [Tanacetum cinerariifolium]
MQTRSSSKHSRDQTSNPPSSTNPTPKGQIRKSSKQKVKNSNFEEHLPPIATMTDNRTMAEMLRAPTEGCVEAIVVPLILAEQFELKHSLINMMTSEQFFGLEKDNPHDHIRWFNKITSTIKYRDVRNSVIKLIPFPFSLAGAARRYQDSLNAAAGGNLLEKSPQDALTIIENKSKVKAAEEICVTCGGAHLYYQCLATGGNPFLEFWDNIQGFAQSNVQNNQNRFGQPQSFNRGTNFNQKQTYQATAQSNQNFHLNELEKIKRMNDVSMKAMQNQIDMVKNMLRNEMKTSIQTSLSNQTNEIKNIMASLLQMNTASTSGSRSLPGNTVANPKGKLKAITTCSGLITDGPTVHTPPKSITIEEDECVEETYTDPDLAEYTIKVPPPHIQKYKPLVQRNFVLHTKDSLLPNIPYPSRMLKQKQQKKDEIQIQKFWHMFKQLYLNITLAEASRSSLKKLPEKLRDPGKFLIPCGFSKLKYKALADLGASINLMPLSVWKKLGLPDLILTRMTLKLANRAICTPDGIARDVFVLVGKFTFPADFVVVDYERDLRVTLILGRPFLRTARALIDVHGEEMILRDGDKRLTLNMKHDTASYSNHPRRESANLINIFNVPSEDCLEFTDELALITYPPDYDDNLQFDIESDLREIEFLLYQGKDSGLKDSIDQTDLANLDDYFVDPTPEMFTDEHVPDYLVPLRFDVYDDDFLEDESDADNFYDDPFDSKGEKIKESKLLIDELDLPCDFLPYSEYDSFAS